MNSVVDETEWPIVLVRWRGAVEDSLVAGFLARMDGWLQRGQRFGLLIDSRDAKGLSPEQRVLLIGHMKRQEALTASLLVQAIVLDNLMQRTLFYGINLIFPNPFPSKVFAEPETARAWLVSVLGSEQRR